MIRVTDERVIRAVGEFKIRGFGEMIAVIARTHHVTPEQILARVNTKNVVQARAKLGAMLRQEGLSWPEVGGLMLRDHTTVMTLVKKYFGDTEPDRIGEDAPTRLAVVEGIAGWLDAVGFSSLGVRVRAGEWRAPVKNRIPIPKPGLAKVSR